MHQIFLKSIIAMVCAIALLSLAQMWGPILSWDIFIKTIITLGVLVVLAALIMALKSDLGSHKKMKDDNYLD